MNAAHTTGQSSLLKLFDKNSKLYFLVDTGAEVSVYPACRADRLNKSNVTLRAANNSFISTYRHKKFVLDFGLPRPLTWNFQVADVTQPIIGADFLLQHKLLVDLAQKRLIDTRNGTRITAESSQASSPSLHVISSHPLDPDPFTRLLAEFPTLTTPCTSDTPVRHSVSHHIVTEGPPSSPAPDVGLLKSCKPQKPKSTNYLTWELYDLRRALGLRHCTWSVRPTVIGGHAGTTVG